MGGRGQGGGWRQAGGRTRAGGRVEAGGWADERMFYCRSSGMIDPDLDPDYLKILIWILIIIRS